MQKYSVDRVVGEGSFGKALLCKRKSDGRKCIVKEISLSKMSRQEAKATEQESALLARLQHPNIVSFWESFNEVNRGKSNLYIVMDFADGGDLSDLIKNRRNRLMSETQVINIAVQISLAMKHVHDRKILHRDLKSGNIFLTKSGVVKLGDFGIARVLRNTGELASTQIGTPYFMSPEILQNKRYNSKTDIWSLGCVFYELAALKVPFSGTSMKQLVNNIVRQATPRISSQYSKEFSTLLSAMLAKNPKERPSVNRILAQPVMRNQIATILDDGVRQSEFSHTILHGDHILKKPPLVSEPLSAIKEEASKVRQGGPPRAAPPRPSATPAPVPHVNKALQEARARANAQAQAQAQVQAQAQQREQAARAREYEARRKIEEMKLEAAKLLRRKQLAEQAARDAAIQKRREKEKEKAEKMAVMRKQEQIRRQEKAALLAKQQEAERERLAQYRKASEAREKERALIARAKLIEERKQYEQNKRAAEEAASRDVNLAPPPPPQGSKPIHQRANQPAAVVVARGGVGFNIKGGGVDKRHNPRMKPSVPRQNQAQPSARNDALRIDGQGQERPRPQARAQPAKGGGRILVVKEGYGAPSAAQQRRERFERLQAKANASQELARQKSEEKKVEASKNQQQKIAQQVGQLGCEDSSDSDSDSDTEEVTFKPAPKKKPAIAVENNWFSDLEKQMGDLKGDLNNLREGKSPKALPPPPPKSAGKAVPPSHPPKVKAGVAKSTSNDSKRQPPAAKTPPSAQELALRKVKREEESKNLREFVRAQRNQMGTPSPPPPPNSGSGTPKANQKSKAPENLSKHFSQDKVDPPSPPPSDVQVPPPKNMSAAEAMRKKRDAERREMKKMIAEKRNEKLQILRQTPSTTDTTPKNDDDNNDNEKRDISGPTSPQGELHVLDEDTEVVTDSPAATKEESTDTKSPAKGVKFQDFLGRDYTPVTSEEDAAVLEQMKVQPELKPSLKVMETEIKPAALTSTDDFELNRRTEAIYANHKEATAGKVLVSSSCGDLSLSLKKAEGPQEKAGVQVVTVVESHVEGDVEKDEEDQLEATNQVFEQLDPDVYEQLAEEMGEGWGDYTPERLDAFGNKLEDDSPGLKEVEGAMTEKEKEEEEEEGATEQAAEEFNNMLSVMQDALNNIPEGRDNNDDDDDSAFEEEEPDEDVNRVVGTFSPTEDELEEVVEGLKHQEEEDGSSLGSSWGDVEEDEEEEEGLNYEVVDHDQGHEHHNKGGDDYDDDDDDIPPPAYVSEHDMTVYGVPFPIDTAQRESDGRLLNTEDSAACRMEYIREFLENALGEDKFVQAYRLLKQVDIVDEDALLEQMENIVGTDGLKHMGVFIQLITIEEKFENF